MEEEKNRLQSQIETLKLMLTGYNSSIGDWKIIKNLEFQQAGLAQPYDALSLHKERQAIRDQINALEEQLKSLDNYLLIG